MTQVFISASLSNKRAIENQTRTTALSTFLKYKGYKFTDCLGMYKGNKELSFAIECQPNDVASLREIATMFDQESILVVDDLCELIYSNFERDVIGTKLVEVTDVSGLESYTLLNNRYWVVK